MNASVTVRTHPRRRWLQRQYEVRTFEESGAYWARRYPMNEPTAAVRKAMRNVLPVAAPTWMPLTLKAKRPARRIWHSPVASPTMTDPTAPPRRKRVPSRRAERYAPAAVPTRRATPTSVNGEWMVAGWCCPVPRRAAHSGNRTAPPLARGARNECMAWMVSLRFREAVVDSSVGSDVPLQDRFYR
ncbi:hypothetical protein BMIN_1499 [Bifidobacterium minimum]|uniref:Uncharacterized protein n=1 Tax=Bifidobacterium minimum TaxID=1693 RepID=A0A087BLD3_9BIFI|nr:hypothetical protein BMIN_1499 [Bifidobacterium minimum]